MYRKSKAIKLEVFPADFIFKQTNNFSFLFHTKLNTTRIGGLKPIVSRDHVDGLIQIDLCSWGAHGALVIGEHCVQSIVNSAKSESIPASLNLAELNNLQQ